MEVSKTEEKSKPSDIDTKICEHKKHRRKKTEKKTFMSTTNPEAHPSVYGADRVLQLQRPQLHRQTRGQDGHCQICVLYSIQDNGFAGGHCSGGKVYCYNNKQTGVEIYGNFVHSMDPNVACISDFKFKTDEQQKGFLLLNPQYNSIIRLVFYSVVQCPTC